MRSCIRCRTEMIENCDIRLESSAVGIVLAADDRKLFPKRLGKPKVCICPNCGEVSIFIENPERLAQ